MPFDLLGDIVRIAPNELVFVTPQALTGKYLDTYLPAQVARQSTSFVEEND